MVVISEMLSCGLILFLGHILNILLNKIHVPGLVGMMILGVFIGPEFGNLIGEGILKISSHLRTMALIVVLSQSGLHLDLASLKKVGRPAIMLSFVPATFEIIGDMLGSRLILKFTYAEGLSLGAVLGSVSPAIITSKMVLLISKGLGKEHSIPQLILAGAGCDDIYTIVLFYAFLSIVGSSKFDWKTILGIPISIVSGVLLGLGTGFLSALFFEKTSFSLAANTLVIFSVGMLLDGLEQLLDEFKKGTNWEFVAISGLLGVIVNGVIILYKLPDKAKEFAEALKSVWTFFEIILFVLVGATLSFDKDFASNLGKGIGVLFFGLVFRIIGINLCLIKTPLTLKERLYLTFSFASKATVQASTGGIALARGLDCGKVILIISIISIIITAPLGSAWMEYMAPVLLKSKEISTASEDSPGKEENDYFEESDKENEQKKDDNKVKNKEENQNKIEIQVNHIDVVSNYPLTPMDQKDEMKILRSPKVDENGIEVNTNDIETIRKFS